MSTNTQAISDDIMQAAYDCARGIYLNVDDGGTPYMTDDDILEVAKAIHDAVMAERGRDQWQPIETAPENRAILVHVPHLDYYGNNGVYAGMLVNMGTGRRWMTFGHAIGRDLGPETAPTHWQPLPAAPKAEG